MFCIVLYAYTLISLYICLIRTHVVTTVMFLTSLCNFNFCSLQFPFNILPVLNGSSLQICLIKICVEWQKSVQLGNVYHTTL